MRKSGNHFNINRIVPWHAKLGTMLHSPRRIVAMLLVAFTLFSVLLPASIWRTSGLNLYNGYTPNVSVRESDPGTMNSYIANLGTQNEYSALLSDEWGSRYAGRLWADKSVFATDLNGDFLANTDLKMKYDGYDGLVFADSDFLHAYSLLGSSQVLNKYPPTPIDLMLVLDVSSSMQSGDDSNSRVSRIVKAADALITELMQMNPYNRVGIVLFDNNPYIFVPLDHYEPSNGYYDEATETGGFIDTNHNPITMDYDAETDTWGGIGTAKLNGSKAGGYNDYTNSQQHETIHYNFLSVEGGYPTLTAGYHGQDDALYGDSSNSYGTGRTISFRYLKSDAYVGKNMTPWENDGSVAGDWMSGMHANGLSDYNTTKVNGMTAEQIESESEVTHKADGSLHPAFASVNVAKDVNTTGGVSAQNVATDTIVLSQITEGGTNMQGGYWLGLRLLSEADDTFVNYSNDLYENTARLPVFVMLSDGLANYAGDYSTWWAPGTVGIATRNTFVRRSGTSDVYPRWITETYNWNSNWTTTDTLRALKPLMTAAYWKKVANANYQEDLQFYTIGVDQTNVRARVSLDPTNYLTRAAADLAGQAGYDKAAEDAKALLDAAEEAVKAAQNDVQNAQAAFDAAEKAEAAIKEERDAINNLQQTIDTNRDYFSDSSSHSEYWGSRVRAARERLASSSTAGSASSESLRTEITEVLDVITAALESINSFWLNDSDGGARITDAYNAVNAWEKEYAADNDFSNETLLENLAGMKQTIGIHRATLLDAQVQLTEILNALPTDDGANTVVPNTVRNIFQTVRDAMASSTNNGLTSVVRPLRYAWYGEYHRLRDDVVHIYTDAVNAAKAALDAAGKALTAAEKERDNAEKAYENAVKAAGNADLTNYYALENILNMTTAYLGASGTQANPTYGTGGNPRYYFAQNATYVNDFTFFHPTNLNKGVNQGAYGNPIIAYGADESSDPVSWLRSGYKNNDYRQANYFIRRNSVPVLSESNTNNFNSATGTYNVIPITVLDNTDKDYNAAYDLDKIFLGQPDAGSGLIEASDRGAAATMRDAANPYMYGAYWTQTWKAGWTNSPDDFFTRDEAEVDSSKLTPDFYAQFDILSWEDLWFDDAYFNADAYQDNFEEIFSQILELVKGYAFTPVGGTNDAGVDDSITYFDPIGDYMEIKNGRVNVTNGNAWNNRGTEQITNADMSLLLFGSMYEIERFGMYDYTFNSGWNAKYGTGSFTEGWYTSDDPETADYLGLGGGSWENGDFYFVNGTTARGYVPTLDENGGTSDKQQNTVYTFYRFKRGGKDKNGFEINDTYITSWRLNPGYDGHVPGLARGVDYNVDPTDPIEDYIITGESMTAEYNTLQEEYSATGNVPNGVYRLSDIRIWVEDTGDYKDVDPGAVDGGSLFAGLGYDQALYVNIPSNASPLQVAEITLDNTGVAYYVTNLGTDHPGNEKFYFQQSTPLRVFYSVGVTDEILDSEGEGIDLTKVSATYYINSHRREDYSVFFLSNYFTKVGTNLDRGDPVVTFSPSTDNRYYVYQKNLLLYTKLYQVVDPGAATFETAFKEVTGDSSWSNTDNAHELKSTFKTKEAALLASATLKAGDYIFIQSAEDMAQTLDDDAYYFIAIDFYQPTGEPAQGSDVPEDAQKGRLVQFILCRTGFQLRAGSYGNLHRSEMLCWYNIDESTVGETGLTKEYAAGNDNSYPNPGTGTTGGTWVLSTNPGGMRISDLDSNVKELKDKYGNEIDKDTEYPEYPNLTTGNVTETALNFYSPIVSQSSDATKDIKINVYLGNNGRVRVEDSVLTVTKQVNILPEDENLISASTLKALNEKLFTYQIYVEGFTGIHGAIKLKYEDDFWWRRFEAVWALTDSNGLLTYDSDVLVAVNGEGEVQNVGQGADGLWYQLDEYKNIDYTKNVVSPGELYYVYVKDARGVTNESGAALVYSDKDGVYKEYGTMSEVRQGTDNGNVYYYKEFTADVLLKSVDDISDTGTLFEDFPIARTLSHIDGNPDSTYDIYSADHFDLGAEFLTVYMYFGMAETPEAVENTNKHIEEWKIENGINFVYPAPTVLLDPAPFSGGGKDVNGDSDEYLDVELIKRHTAQFTLSHGEGLLFNGIGENGDYRVTEKLWDSELDSGWDIWRANGSETKPKGTPDSDIIDFTDVRATQVAIRHAQDDIFTNYDYTGEITDIWSRWDAGADGWVNQLWANPDETFINPQDRNSPFETSAHVDREAHVYSVSGDTSRAAEAVQYQNMFRPAYLEMGKTSAGRDNDETEYAFEVTLEYETTTGTRAENGEITELTEWVSVMDADYHAYKHVIGHENCSPEKHVCDENGDTDVSLTFANGKATVNLKSGEALVITGLPRGAKYTVTEIEPILSEGEELKAYIDVFNGSEDDDLLIDTDSFTVTGRLNRADIEDNVEVVFVHYTNVFGDVNLIVKKRVEGDAGDKEKEFRFTVTLYHDKEHTRIVETVGNKMENGEVVGEYYGDMLFKNGVAEFTLRNGQSISGTAIVPPDDGNTPDVPVIYYFTVVEEDPDGHVVSWNGTAFKNNDDGIIFSTDSGLGTTATGQIQANETATIEFINYKANDYVELPGGGGTGVSAFYLSGTLLLIAAGILLFIKRKRGRIAI